MIESRRKEIDSAVIDRTIPFRISFPAKRIKLHRYIYSEGTGRGERGERERERGGGWKRYFAKRHNRCSSCVMQRQNL